MNGVDLAVDGLLDEHLLLVGSEDILRAEDSLSGGPSAIGGIEVVVVADVIEVTALESVAVADDTLLADVIEVLVELANLDIADAAGYVDLAIVEEHAGIVVDARELLFLPRPAGISGGEQPSTGIIAVDEQIEASVVPVHRAGPHATGIGIVAVGEVIVVGGG